MARSVGGAVYDVCFLAYLVMIDLDIKICQSRDVQQSRLARDWSQGKWTWNV